MLTVPPLAGIQGTIEFLLPRVAEATAAAGAALCSEKGGPVWVYEDGKVRKISGRWKSPGGIYLPLDSGGWLALVRAKRPLDGACLAQYCNQALANARQYDAMRDRTWTDALTGIPNRIAFCRRLDEELRRGGKFCLLFFDVNDFKRVNDTYGHLVGDEVLRHVAARLKASLRTGDFVARYGGDEFVALLPRTERTAGERIGERLGRQAVRAGDLAVTLAWGLAARPDDGDSPEALLAAADRHMYDNKRKKGDL